jgi:hypothetical protein
MPRLLVPLTGCVAVGALTLGAEAARARDITRVPAADLIKHAARLGKKAAPYLELLQLADEVTTREGGVRFHMAGKPVLEALCLEARFRLPAVEVEDFVTNAIFSAEVPGRRVSVRLRLDCIVHCSLDLGQFRVERDRDYSDTFVVYVPPIEVRATLPRESAVAYQVDYGHLRSRLLDSDRADDLKRKLYRAACERAVQEFRKASLPLYRNELVKQLQRALRARFPGLRIHVE